ncbi:MAG TPA: ATP-dependent Clp protease ATP-binding subunit [Myxococcales bacterium LLY-WYZ-16_1]|jgi:ATP-dependent Clp protease ATP-binding subunit ClpC|nr:ATP-dependent Clp protease ATP-binding subunit [Myxococcales bacterium LLY-WYZ-16_1]
MLKLTRSAERLIDLARRDAASRAQQHAGFRNVLLAALDLGPEGPLAAAYGDRSFPRNFRAALEQGIPARKSVEPKHTVPVAEALEEILEKAKRGSDSLDVHAVLEAVVTIPVVRAVLDGARMGVEELLETAYDEYVPGDAGQAPEPAPAGEGSASPSSKTSNLLEKFGRDLTAEARDGKLHPALGREREVANLCASLLRMQQNNPLLIGLPGTGKTAIIEHLALEAANGRVGQDFENVRIVEIDLPGLVAGTRFRGDFEERIKGIVQEVKEAKGGIVPFIDEIHLLMGAGATSGGMDAGNILKPPLARGELRLIGATTPEEYRTSIAKDPAMARRFGPVHVEPPDAEATLQILHGVKERIGKHHGLRIDSTHCEVAVRLAGRYVRNRNFPDKAIVVLDQAAAIHRVERNDETQADGERVLDLDTVYQAVERLTGVAASRLAKGEGDRLAGVEGRLTERIIGQPDAIEGVMRVLRRRAAALSPEERPIGSFLFLGPSGVGKTELARVVAEEFFDSPYAIERFDMSEYAGQAGSASLLGAPAGTVGSDRGGVLTNALQRNPYAVYLFDEIEKADRSTMNIFLQMLDAGRVTGRDGVTVDCSNAILVFTSNLGNREALDAGEISEEQRADIHLNVAQRHLPPELFRRFDDVVPFNALDKRACQKVASLMLSGLGKRFGRSHGHPLRFADEVPEALGDAGYSPLYGARNIRYELERRVERPLVDWILEQEAIGGPVRAEWADGAARFRFEE